jgi:hypothetical protein
LFPLRKASYNRGKSARVLFSWQKGAKTRKGHLRETCQNQMIFWYEEEKRVVSNRLRRKEKGGDEIRFCVLLARGVE